MKKQKALPEGKTTSKVIFQRRKMKKVINTQSVQTVENILRATIVRCTERTIFDETLNK